MYFYNRISLDEIDMKRFKTSKIRFFTICTKYDTLKSDKKKVLCNVHHSDTAYLTILKQVISTNVTIDLRSVENCNF